MKNKLYLDADGVLVNTIKAVCDCYNEDYRYYTGFASVEPSEINTWDFTECTCTNKEYVNGLFSQPRFFKRLELMKDAFQALKNVKDYYDIEIVSMGFEPNLRLKEIYFGDHLPFTKFTGVNICEHNDKSHIDMSDGIFIDDCYMNLSTSNAKTKILYGKRYPWNNNWNGSWFENWDDLKTELLDKSERKSIRTLI